MNDDRCSRPPLTWLILGDRAGDNAQVRAMGQALGWPNEVKQIYYDENCQLPFKDRGASLIGINIERSDSLSPPWPDAIIAIGRRSVPVTRWIRKQVERHILHIHLGRPRIDLSHFDLVVTTPQYNLPKANNVIEITLPLVAIDAEQVGKAAAKWHERFALLPRPWTAVMVGGPTPQLAFGIDEGQRLTQELSAYAKDGGGVIVTTSPRTPSEVIAALRIGLAETLPGRHLFFPFELGGDNPYLGMLALADSFVVSIDSASMIAESATRQKPLYLFHLPKIPPKVKPGLKSAIARNWRLRRKTRQDANFSADFLDKLYDSWTRRGKARPRRDIDQLEMRLLNLGIAQSLESPHRSLPNTLAQAFKALRDEQELVTQRAQALWRKICEKH